MVFINENSKFILLFEMLKFKEYTMPFKLGGARDMEIFKVFSHKNFSKDIKNFYASSKSID